MITNLHSKNLPIQSFGEKNVSKSSRRIGKRCLIILFALTTLSQVVACFNIGAKGSDSNLKSESHPAEDKVTFTNTLQKNDASPTNLSLEADFSLPIYPDRIDLGVGTEASQQLRDLTSNKAAAILVESNDCDFCSELRSSLVPLLKASNLSLIIPDKEIASSINSDNTVSLHFLNANGVITGREILSPAGVFDNSRISWLAKATQSIGSAPISPISFSDKPQNKFVVVTDQAVSLYSVDTGLPLETIVFGKRFENAWSLSKDIYGISECCEPAAGRIWLVKAGEQLERDNAGFDAKAVRRSPDKNWLLTSSSSTYIWPVAKPFSSDPIDVLPPGSPPLTVEWLLDSLGVVALWSKSEVRDRAAIEIIGLSNDLQIASRRFIAVPPETVGIAPLKDGMLVLAINGKFPALVSLDPNSGTTKQLTTLTDKILSISLNQSGHKLLTLTETSQAIVLNTEDWTEVLSVRGPFKSANW